MKTLTLLSYTYPNTIKLRIGSCIYVYESSEFFCRKFMHCYERGARFNALNWFKRVSKAKLEGKLCGR